MCILLCQVTGVFRGTFSITLQALLHGLFPVDGDDSGALDSNRFDTGVYVEL